VADVGGAGTHVTVADINTEMLAVGRERAAKTRHNVDFIEANAEQLPLPDRSFDAVTIAFGIRNVTRVDAALAAARRVLAPGGHFACLEFSNVDLPLLKQAYDAYSEHAIPALGGAVAGDAASYRYLVESIRRFPDRRTFAALMRDAGMGGVRYEALAGGVCAIHHGFRL
jgi:demethylmenaquinone methyltransferase/2-methoxy-6-polyprenyl-1,4-benzoquinol methylase